MSSILATAACPEPGIHQSVPMEQYLSWDAASHSLLERVRLSPAHAAWTRTNGTEDSEALTNGTAIHAALLEPEKFDDRYALRPEGDGRTAAVRSARLELEAKGLILLERKIWDLCCTVRAKIQMHASAWQILSHVDTSREVSLVWDQITARGFPVRCKARPDVLNLTAGITVDVKSCVSAEPEDFRSAVFRFGYHRSAAHYLDGMRALGLSIDCYIYLAIEKEPPYEIALYALEQSAIEAGWAESRVLLDRYGECVAKNDWPGYSRNVMTTGLPAWAFNRVRYAN